MIVFFGRIFKTDCLHDIYYSADYQSHLETNVISITCFAEESEVRRAIHSNFKIPFVRFGVMTFGKIQKIHKPKYLCGVTLARKDNMLDLHAPRIKNIYIRIPSPLFTYTQLYPTTQGKLIPSLLGRLILFCLINYY